MFEAFWGSALKVRRVYEELPKEELLIQLNARISRNLSLELLDGMEMGIEDIDQELFAAWCDILGCSQVSILKSAQFLLQQASKSEIAQLQDLERELDFLKYKDEHKKDSE